MTEQQATELIVELDSIARDYDGYGYGLPIFEEETMGKMRAAVLAAAQKPIGTEAKGE